VPSGPEHHELRAAKKWRPLAPSAAHTKSSGLQDARIHFKDEDRTNGVALPVDEGYIMLGHLVERAGAAAAALVKLKRN
jgi:hypothetical protein